MIRRNSRLPRLLAVLVAVSVAGAALQVYRMASAHGFGRKDTSSVYQFLKPAAKDAPV